MASRESFVNVAKLAEKAERHDDTVEAMKNAVKLGPELTVEVKGNERQVELIRDYRQSVESDISSLCNDALTLLDEHILPSSSCAESSVFYHKLKGDYYRYLAEIKIRDERREAASQSLQAYQTATTRAEEDLPPAHPSRIGLGH